MNPSGLAYGGQIWLRNNVSASDGELRSLAMHELFHLVQYNYLGYNLDADLLGWAVNAPKLALRDLWLIESTASWAPGIVETSLKRHDQGWGPINRFRETINQPLSYAVIDGKNADDRQYGAVVFPLSLVKHQRMGQSDIVREMFEKIEQNPDDPFSQIDVISGTNLVRTLTDFATANYLYQDTTRGYEQADWSVWPSPVQDVVKDAHKFTLVNFGDTVSGSGEVYGLGAEYIEISTTSHIPYGNALIATFQFTTNYPSEFPVKVDIGENLKIRLLLQASGGNWSIQDVDVPSHLSLDGLFQYAVMGQYDKIVFILMDTKYFPYSSIIHPHSSLASYHRIDFDYTLKLTYAEKKPPLVYACIQEESIFGATVKAAAIDVDSQLAEIKFGFSAPTILSPTVEWWEDTRFVPFLRLPGWSFTATDSAGNVATLSAPLQDCDDGDGGGGGGGGGNTCGSAYFRPGCDNPDDNVSSAMPSPQSVTLPEGVRAEPAVGILQRGYAANAQSLVESVGERAWPVSIYFDPVATAQLFPVLLIPSGGLYGLENDAAFRARLEEYARQGGTIVAFAQQHGYEYAALPGGEVNGYGWNEDISCFQAALRMETWHPILAGFNHAELTVHVDGYFSAWPADAQVLLSRTANGQPGALLYPYPPSPPAEEPVPSPSRETEGGQGYVFATTIYDDWGTLNGQASADARALLRDLLTWGISSAAEEAAAEVLPQAVYNAPLTLTFPITNTTPYTVAAVQLAFVTPARRVALTHTIAITIAPGQSITLGPSAYPVLQPSNYAPYLGLWRVDAQLLTSHGARLTPYTQIARFVVARPPAIVDPAAPLYLSITGPGQAFVANSHATFEYHLYNRSAVPLTATVSYGFDHWFLRNYTPLAENVVVPPAQGDIHGEIMLPLELLINDEFRLRGYATTGAYQATASYGVLMRKAAVEVAAMLQPAEIQRGAETTLTLRVTNSTGLPFTPTLQIEAFDAAHTLYHTATLTVAMPAQRADVWPWWPVVTHTFTVPATAAGGAGPVWIEALADDGRVIGGGVAALHIPSSPLVFSIGQPQLVSAGSLATPLTLTNTGVLPITSGALTLTLTAPGDPVTVTATTAFTLAPLTSQALTLPLDVPPLAFGEYTLTLDAADEYGARRQQVLWPAALLAQTHLDQDSYRARETAAVALTLDNAGPFHLPLTVTLAAPALSYVYTQPLTLDPDAEDALSWDIPLPSDVAAGAYPLYVTATLPSGDVWGTPAGALVVPPARLEWDADVPPAATAGDTLALYLYNSGGVDAEAAVSLRLLDARGLVVAAWAEQAGLPAGDEQGFTLTVPDQTRSGVYTLLAQATLPGAEPVSYWQLVQIDGVTAGLTATTDKERYTFWDSLDAAATIANGPRPLSDAQLQLEIVQAEERLVPARESCLYDDPECGLFGYQNVSASAIAVDAGGNRWFGTTEQPEGTLAHLDRLAADGVTWQTVELPVDDDCVINDVSVGPDDRVWLALRTYSYYDPPIGVAVLLSNTTWLTYSAASSGLLSNGVVRVTPDAMGNVWFASHPVWDDDLGDYRDGGLSVLRADDTWITYTTANSGLLTGSPTGLAVDAAGNVWVAGDGLSQLRAADSMWITYTTANSPLLTDNPTDVAVDASGDVWVAGDGLSRLHAGTTWFTYTTVNSGLQSSQINHLAVAADGRIWAAAGYDYVQVYDPATAASVLYALPGVTYSDILDLAVGPDPDEVWIGTRGGVVRYRLPGVATRVLWQETFPINLAASAQEDVSTYLNYVATLGAPGKFHLQARLLAATGQELAAAAQPFYVDPSNADGCALTVNLTPTVAAPLQPLQVYGAITSQYSDYEDVQLAVTLDDATIVISDAMTLPYGIPVPYTLTLPAPDRAGVFLVTAELRLSAEGAPVTLNERLVVDAPAVEAALAAPTVAGRAPFDVALTLENPSALDLALTVTRDGAPPETLTLPAGARALRLWSQHITTDTLLTVTLSGDVSQVLTQSVAFGEGLTATWTPEAYALPGQMSVPYTFTNTGQLDLAFTTCVTLTNESEEIAAAEFTKVLLAGNASAGQVVFADIPPGDYTFSASTPWSADAFSLTVRPVEAAALDVLATPAVGAAVTVTAHVTNTGAAPLEAVVHVQAPFDTVTPVLLAPAETLILPLVLDLSALAPGAWPLTLTVESGGGAILDTAVTTVTVPQANLVVTAVPTDTRVTAGETVTLTFDVANRGAAPDTAVLTVTLGNLLDDTQRLWLPGGAAGTLAFVFDAPVGLSGETLVGYYHFGGHRYDLALPIDGVDLSVDAGWDQPFYDPGVTATLRLTVTNHGAAGTPPLYAAVGYDADAYAGAVVTQPLTLAGGATQALDFSLTAGDYTGDTLVFYAVYEADEQRGIHLNTTYLRLRQPVVTVIPDRTVYRPGDTVHAAVVTTATGTLTVTAPGFTTVLSPTACPAPPTPCFQFALPDTLLRGTYTINYVLALSGGGEAVGRVPFDVNAPWVRVTEASLLDPRPTPGETLRAELTVASTDALTVALRSWLRYPDGTRSETAVSIIPLAAVLNNHLTISHTLSTAHSGAHQLIYQVSVPDNQEEMYASGFESFMVGAATLLHFATDRTVYGDPSAPVTARVGVYAALTTPATLTLTLDDLSQHTYPLTLLTGTQTLTFTWPQPITLGDHILAGRLSVAGLAATAQTHFRYGVEAADLAVAAPRLSADDGSLTRTVTALVYNRGGFPAVTTTVQFWDGAPGVGTLLGTAPLPPLAAGAMTNVATDWSIQGQGGLHTLYVVVDPTAQVTEFDEDNNTASAVVSLPRLVLHVTPEQSTYTLGQPVTALVTATNLSSATALENLAITTTFEYVGWLTAFQTTHTVTLAAADTVAFPVVWPSTGFTGTYFIRVQSADPTGEFHEATTSFYLDATPVSGQPLVNLGPERSVAEGSPITFTATITDPDTPTGHILHWDFGDGGAADGTLTPTHVYADDGVYPVTLTVTDTAGLSGAGHLTVTVANVAPIVTAGPDRTVAVSETLAFNGVFTDPGVLDTHTIAWDFGDGITTTSALTPTHVYTAAGAYTITLTVTDDDGGVGSATTRAVIRPPFAAFAVEHAAIQWGRDTGDPAAFTLIGQLELPDGYTNADLERSLTLTLQIGAGSVSQTVALRQIGRDVWLFYGEFDPAAEGLQWGEVMIIWQGPGAAQAAHCLLQGLLTIPGVDHNTRPAAATVNLQFPLAEDGAPGWLAGTASPAFRTYRRLWWYEPR